MNREPSNTLPRTVERHSAAPLVALFAVLYFAQGISEPTEGLVAQPVRSLLKHRGHEPDEISIVSMFLSLPWVLKPLYGLLTDFFPIFGTRRRSYLMLCGLAAFACFYAATLLQPKPGTGAILLGVLLAAGVAVAFSDVVVDALMVHVGQPRGITGRLQSAQWAAMYSAAIVTGTVGGYISQSGLQPLGFSVCGMAALVTLSVAVFAVNERPQPRPAGFRKALLEFAQAVKSPIVLGVGGFLFLWNFNPFSSSVLQSHMTGAMGLSEQFYGHLHSCQAAASVLACLCYARYCRRVRRDLLIHASIVLGIASTLAYWGMRGTTSTVLVWLAVGFTYMTATLIQLDLAAQVCPPDAAGTVFALLMAIANGSTMLATGAGGVLYQWGITRFGDAHASFAVLVAGGAALTACCWFLVPLLKRLIAQAELKSAV